MDGAAARRNRAPLIVDVTADRARTADRTGQSENRPAARVQHVVDRERTVTGLGKSLTVEVEDIVER